MHRVTVALMFILGLSVGIEVIAGGCGAGGAGVYCNPSKNSYFEKAFSGEPVGVPVPLSPFPGGAGYSTYPGLDAALLNTAIGFPFSPEVFQRAREVLQIAPDADFFQMEQIKRGQIQALGRLKDPPGPVVIIVGDPEEKDKMLPEFQNGNNPFMNAFEPIMVGLEVREGIKRSDIKYFVPGETGFKEVSWVVQEFPNFFRRVIIISHGNLSGKGDKTRAYSKPDVTDLKGITFTAAQIRECGFNIMFFSCAADIKGILYGQMENMAQHYGETGHYPESLQQIEPYWPNTFYGRVGISPQIPEGQRIYRDSRSIGPGRRY